MNKIFNQIKIKHGLLTAIGILGLSMTIVGPVAGPWGQDLALIKRIVCGVFFGIFGFVIGTFLSLKLARSVLIFGLITICISLSGGFIFNELIKGYKNEVLINQSDSIRIRQPNYLNYQNKNHLSVIVDDIPRPVSINFPIGFSLPNTDKEHQRRKKFLNYYKYNPSMKGKYNEILMLEWNSPARVPIIIVGSLGATQNHQGKISTKDWRLLRDEFLQYSRDQIKSIRELTRNVERNAPIPVKTIDELFWIDKQSDPSSVILLLHNRSKVDGVIETVFSARKLLYFNGFLIFVNVIVDSSKPDALKVIKEYLDQIYITSI